MSNIKSKFSAGYPIILATSPEDIRCRREIEQAAAAADRTAFLWTLGEGLRKLGAKLGDPIPSTGAPKHALVAATKGDTTLSPPRPIVPEKSVVILRHFHLFWDNPEIQSLLLDSIKSYKFSRRTFVITAPPEAKIPPELASELAIVDLPLPDKKLIRGLIEGIVKASTKMPADMVPSDEEIDLVCKAASGLTENEAENAIAEAMIINKEQSRRYFDHHTVMDIKCDVLRRGGQLEYVKSNNRGMSQIGGMDNLKDWIRMREDAFTPEAREFGIEEPKGVLLVGIPGTGKSLSARAVADTLGLPLLRLDAGRLFAGLVGQSESNTRMAIAKAEAMAPCVLWIDELEKGFAGSTNSLDSGVGARVVGTFLTWMNEKTSPVMVFATANDVSKLPPELLRKGRFDEIFSVDLPNAKEREEILAIHITKRGRGKLLDEKKLNLQSLVEITQGFSGSELEAGTKDALYRAFHAKKDLNQLDLQDAFTHTTPLSRTMGERLTQLSQWYRTHTRPANRQEEPEEDVEGRDVDA